MGCRGSCSSTRCTCWTSSACFLNRALESTLAPIVVFATNRGICHIRGTEMLSPHGIPVDLLDRLLIIRALPYLPEEIMQIINIRASAEGLTIDETGIAKLAEIGTQTSLRYVSQLLTPAKVLAVTNGKEAISGDDVSEIASMFLDAKKSAVILKANEDKFIS